MGSAFTSGQLAAKPLLTLLAKFGEESMPLKPASVETVQKVLQEIWSCSTSGEPDERVLGFFSQILSERGYSSDILNLWGTDQLFYEQEHTAPISNIPMDSGLLAFADWTGESDGDAWCYDIKHGCIRCIPVDSGYADADKSRLESYGVFPQFEHFAAYLRCEAELRGWLQNR
jgi:hypothetical protein